MIRAKFAKIKGFLYTEFMFPSFIRRGVRGGKTMVMKIPPLSLPLAKEENINAKESYDQIV